MKPIPEIGPDTTRIPEAGRIRMGKKGPKHPIKLDTWRLTSTDKGQIDSAANIYGGTVEPWHNDALNRDEWEVITDTEHLDVILVNQPVRQRFTERKGSAIVRSCDGRESQIAVAGPEGEEIQVEDCVCRATEQFDCKPTTSLSVVLAALPFRGTWRLTSTGWNAFYELAGSDFVIKGMSGSSMVPARLSLEHRSQKVQVGGKTQTRQFIVPVLSTNVSPSEAISQLTSSIAEGYQLPANAHTNMDEAAPIDITENPKLIDTVRQAWLSAPPDITDQLIKDLGGYPTPDMDTTTLLDILDKLSE